MKWDPKIGLLEKTGYKLAVNHRVCQFHTCELTTNIHTDQHNVDCNVVFKMLLVYFFIFLFFSCTDIVLKHTGSPDSAGDSAEHLTYLFEVKHYRSSSPHNSRAACITSTWYCAVAISRVLLYTNHAIFWIDHRKLHTVIVLLHRN